MWHQTLCLLISLSGLKAANKEQWVFVGNPLLHVRPCEGSEDVMVTYEPGRPPGEENQYQLQVFETIPAHSQVNLEFDTEATVTLLNSSVARISTIGDSFHIRFFKKAEAVGVMVQGPATGTFPYVTSIVLNQVEYCKKPKTGYLDDYVYGEQGVAQTQLQVPDGSCGRRKVQHAALITNAVATKSGDWPWHTAVYEIRGNTIKYSCGGTLISKTVVLTVAHCASVRGTPMLAEILSVVLGKYNLIGGDIASQEKKVHEVVIHEDFSPTNLDHDIALLKLVSEAEYTDYVQPACLWHVNIPKKLPVGDIFGTIVGWGFDQTDNLASELRQATIPMQSDTTCLKSNPLFFGKLLNRYKFCAGWANGTSPCNGDSGGGFHVFVPDVSGDARPGAPGAWYVRGLVSVSVARRDVALCDPNEYVLFIDVAKYTDWIKKYL